MMMRQEYTVQWLFKNNSKLKREKEKVEVLKAMKKSRFS